MNKVWQKNDLKNGYNSIAEINGNHSNMLMDFGVLKLHDGESHRINESEKEVAVLLVTGDVELTWNNNTESISRDSFLDESPWCLHVPKKTEITISAVKESEIIIQKTDNDNDFKAKLYTQEDCRSEIFGGGVLDETSNRTVRTVFDYNNAPYSNLVIGEVINHPGRWSSYPPHDHPQPEIYHYKFINEQGFGVSIIEDDAFVVKNNDTVCVPPGTVHPQVTAPGYPMWYCWMIRHLQDNPFIDRIFRDEHIWLLDPDVKTWPVK
ncbi:MAG TPA: 5-deoxy-glucuronate isomerase [Victivallales bacterium]|nr:5-deoxy-glucuronate isomerase [Victivallales bacterium]